MSNNVETKVCKVCGNEKSVSEFGSKRNMVCKTCKWIEDHEDLDMINDLSKDENVIILDYILNSRINFLNEFETILHKPLNDILINIQKLNIRNYNLTVKINCNACGKEISYKLTSYLNRDNYFCSRECQNYFQSYSYGCKDGYQKCGFCTQEKPYDEFSKNGKDKYATVCKVCEAINKRNIIYDNIFTEQIVHMIFDNILNSKIESLNQLSLLINIELDLLIPFVKIINISKKPIKLEFNCPVCSKQVFRIISLMESANEHYCSKECFDIDQSMEILMECKWCGKEFNKTPLKDQENYFCCHDCSTKYHAKKRTKDLIVANCEFCGEEFERKEYNTGKIYCSDECRAKGFNLKMSGKNNPKYVERLTIKCDWCKTEFGETENSYNQSTNHFCSKDCARAYHANVFSQTPEWKEFMRVEMVNRLSDGIMSHTDTKPQLAVNDILKELDVENENEYNCKYYAIDNHLTESNLFIEVMGSFWHTDHRIFDKINYLSQATGISKDKAKKTYIKKYYHINMLYLWEYDINNDRGLCKELITLYVNNKGVLDNYHSFNYHLNNGILTINKNIEIPYMDYDIEDLNKIIDLSVREARSTYQPEKHITYNCEYCGTETSCMLTQYDRVGHHFCSNKCNTAYYGAKRLKSKQLCNVCGNNIPHKNGLCKVCTYKNTHDILYSEIWTEEIGDIILNNVLYKRIEYLNELEEILNIPLKDICEYIKLIGYASTLRTQRVCLQCGEEFTLPMNRIISGKDKFCSPECSQLSKRDRIKLDCECCGKEISRTQSQYDKSKNHFCSHECSDKWMKENRVSTKIDKVCEICEIDYQVVPSQSESVVCSRECQGKWQSLHLVGENANGYKGNK